MALEAELIYRARDTAGRADAAYVILMRKDEHGSGAEYQVSLYWGAWSRYQSGTLQRKSAYIGSSRSAAQSAFILAMGKREQRGYELQAHLSSFPNWLPAPLTAARQPVWQASPEARAVVQPPEPVLLPEPEPPPAGRVKHTRAGFIEL